MGAKMISITIKIRHALGAEKQWARALRISVLLGVSGCLVAADSQAENCWREEVKTSWPFVEFSFATWGDTDKSRAVLVDLRERRSLTLELNQDSESGLTTLQSDFSASHFGDLFNEAPLADGGEQAAELLYGIKPSNGGFVGLNLNASTGVPVAVQWRNASLQKRDSTELQSRVGMTEELIEGNRVMSIWNWQPVGDQFFAYAAFGIASRLDVVREGFFIIQVQTPDNNNVTPVAG